MQKFDAIWTNGHLATFSPQVDDRNGYGEIRNGALAVTDGSIVWMGPERDLPAADADESHDLNGGWLLPGLIDCHTHLIFGGDRANEFERRLQGESYESIARAGGGIRATVEHTRTASEADLLLAAVDRVRLLLAEGVTTLEVKSGYGLDRETELRMLHVARELDRTSSACVRSTFLGPHAVPPEFERAPDAYIDLLIQDVLPVVLEQDLADQVDAFLETIAFTEAQCVRFLEAGRAAGLGVRLHADQLSDGSGAAVAAGLGARSADHLEFTTDAGIRAMTEAGTTAVLLPGAFYVLGQTRPPPVGAMRQAGTRMAVASDLNPGSAPVRSLLMALNMACVLFRLTPAEALRGATEHAAAVLGLVDRGVLEVGLRADLSAWEVEHPRDLCYWIGGTRCTGSWAGGRRVSFLSE